LEFAHLASEFDRWTKESAEAAEATNFGFTLAEVESFNADLTKMDNDIGKEGNDQKKSYDDIWKKLGDLGVKQNIYTNSTPDTLAKSRSSLESALDARRKRYQTELARQRANDALCKEFASRVDPFSKFISEQKDKITKSKLDLESQLKYVNDRLSSISQDGAILSTIRDLSSKIDAAGITNNRHTTLTLKDIEVQWEQYQVFLGKKKKMLEEEIEHAKMRGITAEQFKEIEDTFHQFDIDGNQVIDKKELKACLYSLGEDKTNNEITEIFNKYGKNGVVPYEGFREFMMSLIGDSDTKEEILLGFNLINKGGNIALNKLMSLVMKDSDLEYFNKTAAKSGEGYDYNSWTDDVFSR